MFCVKQHILPGWLKHKHPCKIARVFFEGLASKQHSLPDGSNMSRPFEPPCKIARALTTKLAANPKITSSSRNSISLIEN